MVDRMLGGFDMPVMIEFPIAAADVPKLDAVLVTHSDNDHYSVPTCRDLAQVTGEYHSMQYVASLMKQEGFPVVRSRHRRALRNRTRSVWKSLPPTTPGRTPPLPDQHLLTDLRP
jgi:hypothetical protein